MISFRRVRGEKWLEKFVVSVDLDLHTTPTTTTTTTTTLSPEQIRENKRVRADFFCEKKHVQN